MMSTIAIRFVVDKQNMESFPSEENINTIIHEVKSKLFESEMRDVPLSAQLFLGHRGVFCDQYLLMIELTGSDCMAYANRAMPLEIGDCVIMSAWMIVVAQIGATSTDVVIDPLILQHTPEVAGAGAPHAGFSIWGGYMNAYDCNTKPVAVWRPRKMTKSGGNTRAAACE